MECNASNQMAYGEPFAKDFHTKQAFPAHPQFNCIYNFSKKQRHDTNDFTQLSRKSLTHMLDYDRIASTLSSVMELGT